MMEAGLKQRVALRMSKAPYDSERKQTVSCKYSQSSNADKHLGSVKLHKTAYYPLSQSKMIDWQNDFGYHKEMPSILCSFMIQRPNNQDKRRVQLLRWWTWPGKWVPDDKRHQGLPKVYPFHYSSTLAVHTALPTENLANVHKLLTYMCHHVNLLQRWVTEAARGFCPDPHVLSCNLQSHLTKQLSNTRDTSSE